MAPGDATPTKYYTGNDNAHAQREADDNQGTDAPSLALRLPTYDFAAGCRDAKPAGKPQRRWWLTQITAGACADIVRTWIRLDHSFCESSHHQSAQQSSLQPQYNTFAYSGGNDDAYVCGTCTTTNSNAFSVEIGDMIFEPRINGLLICVPMGAAAYLAEAPAIVVFAINATAIVPLSSLLTDATERIALEAGDAVGAFLNISLGNIVELILFVTLINGNVRIVQASILGSILVNLLPILGSALVATQMTGGDCSLENTETQMLACLLFVSVFVFMIPTAFYFTFRNTHRIADTTLHMSRASAILILVVYSVYFIHTMSGGAADRNSDEEEADQPALVTPPPLLRRTTPPLTPGPRTIRFADERESKTQSKLYARRGFEVGPESVADSTDWQDEEPRGRSLSGTHGQNSAYTVYQPLLPPRMRRYQSRSMSAGSSCSRMSRMSRMSHASSVMSGRRSFARAGLAKVLSNDRHAAELNLAQELACTDTSGRVGAILASTTILVIASILLAVSARLLASTLDAVSHEEGLSETIIGFIILPLAGNFSSYLTVVAVAARDNLDLAVAVSVGSAIQIALCVAPLTVMAGWVLGQPVMLALDVFELTMLLAAASLVNLLVLGDGRAGDKHRVAGLKGGILCACFLVLGIAAFFAPDIN